MIANNPQKLGTVNGADIIVIATSGGFTDQPLVRISLSKTYNRAPPPGWLVQTPPGSKVESNLTTGPRVIPIGAVLDLPKCETDALIAADAATLV